MEENLSKRITKEVKRTEYNSALPLRQKAMVVQGPDSTPSLENLPAPSPGPGEVLIKVHAVSLNPTDIATWQKGEFASGEKAPYIPGYDLAGEIVALGAGVTLFHVGDAVAGMPRFPHPAKALAQYVTSPSRHVIRIPKDSFSLTALDWEQAAALPLIGLTAWQALVDTAQIRPGQKILIFGASGAVGYIAVQIALFLGAEVTAVTSSKSTQLVEALGPQTVLDRQKTGFTEFLGKFDVVLDTVGGENTSLALALTSSAGVTVALHPYQHSNLAEKDKRLRRMLVEPDYFGLKQIYDLWRRQKLHAHVGRTFTFHESSEAFLHMQRGKSSGKTIIKINRLEIGDIHS